MGISTKSIINDGYKPFATDNLTKLNLGWLDKDYQKLRDTMYDPTLRAYLNKATEGIDVNARRAAAAADVEHSFGNQNAQLRRQMSRFGIDPTSGMYQTGLRNLSLTKAAAKAGALTSAAERASQEQFARLSDAAGKVSPLMQAYMVTRGQVGENILGSQLSGFTGMYGAEKSLAGAKARADATRYAADQSLEATKARIASNEALAAAEARRQAAADAAAARRQAASFAFQKAQMDAYNQQLDALNQQEQSALSQYQTSPSNSTYWGQIVGAVTPPTLVNQGIDWLFGH